MRGRNEIAPDANGEIPKFSAIKALLARVPVVSASDPTKFKHELPPKRHCAMRSPLKERCHSKARLAVPPKHSKS